MELKPCPFCGDERPIVKTEMVCELGFPYTRVECWACGASIRGYLEEERAIKAWNRRAEDGK
jgi:Lar family restriction alleviation protein